MPKSLKSAEQLIRRYAKTDPLYILPSWSGLLGILQSEDIWHVRNWKPQQLSYNSELFRDLLFNAQVQNIIKSVLELTLAQNYKYLIELKIKDWQNCDVDHYE